MRHLRTAIAATLAAIVLAALPARANAQDARKADVTGRWTFAVQSEAGSGTPTVTFKQAGDAISGRYSSQALGERDFTGTLKDGRIAFGFSAEVQGQQFSMSFSGTYDGADAMTGSIDFGGMATGTFTAKRLKP